MSGRRQDRVSGRRWCGEVSGMRRGFVVDSFAVALLAAVAFFAAASATHAARMGVVAGSAWVFLLALIVALPALASRHRR